MHTRHTAATGPTGAQKTVTIDSRRLYPRGTRSVWVTGAHAKQDIFGGGGGLKRSGRSGDWRLEGGWGHKTASVQNGWGAVGDGGRRLGRTESPNPRQRVTSYT